MSSIDLGRNLRKLLAAFRTFQHQFSPDGNRNQCTHAAAFSPPSSWNATHTVVDVHPRASTERMRGDTDLRFYTYTCTDLPRVPLCCNFATYYNFPEKKISPGIKWSAHVFTFLHFYCLNMAQAWVRNWPQLYKHIHKGVLVVIEDF